MRSSQQREKLAVGRLRRPPRFAIALTELAFLFSMVLSADGQSLFSAGRDETIKEWDVKSFFPSRESESSDKFSWGEWDMECRSLLNLEGHTKSILSLFLSERYFSPKLLRQESPFGDIFVWTKSKQYLTKLKRR